MKRGWVIVATLVCAACGRDSDAAFERMVDQPKYDSYTPHSMRDPPEGTISVDAESADADRSPIPVTHDLLKRGQERFDIFCAPCHGFAGDGDSIVATKMRLRRPPSFSEERLRRLTPGELYRIVHDGYGLMPSYRQQLSVSERWGVVAYVQALQLSLGVPIVVLPESVRAEALRALK